MTPINTRLFEDIFYVYTSYIYLILVVISCKKKHDLTTNGITKDDTIEIQSISISKEVLAQELHYIKIDSSIISLKNKDSVLAFYKNRNGKAAWDNIKNRTALIHALKTADQEGLNPKDYKNIALEKLSSFTPPNSFNNAIVDVYLTDLY